MKVKKKLKLNYLPYLTKYDLGGEFSYGDMGELAPMNETLTRPMSNTVNAIAPKATNFSSIVNAGKINPTKVSNPYHSEISSSPSFSTVSAIGGAAATVMGTLESIIPPNQVNRQGNLAPINETLPTTKGGIDFSPMLDSAHTPTGTGPTSSAPSQGISMGQVSSIASMIGNVLPNAPYNPNRMGTLAGYSDTQKTVDQYASAVPFYSLGKKIQGYAAMDYKATDNTGKLKNVNKNIVGDTIGAFIDPASSFISGLSGEGWTPIDRAKRSNALAAKNKLAMDTNEGNAAVNNWQKNNLGYGMMANGGNLPTDLFRTDKRAYVDSVLEANKDKDWVKRLREKNTPALQTNKLPDSRYKNVPNNESSTHLMGDNDSGYVYPTIVRENDKLKYLGKNAYDYAKETNTGIQFPVEQGTWFARSFNDKSGYKVGTDVLKNGSVIQKALGGDMSGGLGNMPNSNPVVQTYDVGNKHNELPYNGIVVDRQGNRSATSGKPGVAKVERGESSWKDPSSGEMYVFSDQIPYKKRI